MEGLQEKSDFCHGISDSYIYIYIKSSKVTVKLA